MLSYKPDVFVRKKNVNILLSNINDCNGVGELGYRRKSSINHKLVTYFIIT
jgi:hypothetical protein